MTPREQLLNFVRKNGFGNELDNLVVEAGAKVLAAARRGATCARCFAPIAGDRSAILIREGDSVRFEHTAAICAENVAAHEQAIVASIRAAIAKELAS